MTDGRDGAILRLMLKAVLAFPVAHWRGALPLLPTLVGTLIGLRLAVSWLLPTLAQWSMAVMAADFLVLLWQVTGSLRAIARNQHENPDILAAVTGFGAVGIAILVAIPPHLDRIAAINAVPPPGRPTDFTAGIEGTTLRLTGPISFAMLEAMASALAQSPKLRTVELESPGGRVFAAHAIARQVRERGMDTLVRGTCASACTLVFAAGEARRIGPEARLGFHGYQHRMYVQLVDVAAVEEMDRRMFLERGVTSGFVARIFQAGPTEMWFPDRGELLASGMATSAVP